MAQSHYFDPDTGIITMYGDVGLNNSSGAGVKTTLGLTDFSELNDVKIKLLSIEYKTKIVVSGSSVQDNNYVAFNSQAQNAGGNVVFGVCNQNESSTFNTLDNFTGTSAWPVHFTSWYTLIGNPASVSKTWKPRKMALSDEQVAFVTVKNNSGIGGGQSGSKAWVSIVIRGVRL